MFKKLSILFFVILLNNIVLFSQNKQLDSLLNSYENSKNKNEQIEILYHISLEYFHNKNYERFKFYADKGIDYSKKKNNIHNELRFLDLFAEFYYTNSKYDESLEYYNSIYTISDKNQNTNFKGTAFQGFSKNYWRKGKYNEAVYFGTEAIKIFENIGDTLNAVITKGNLGVIYLDIGNYKKAILIEKKYKYYSGLVFLYQALGRSYFKMKHYRKAKESYFISYNYINKIGEYRELPNIYKLFYELFEKSGDYKNAYKYSIKAMQIKDSISGVEIQNKINDIRIKYESEKKEEENKLLIKNKTLNNQIIYFQKQKNKKQYFILVFVILLLVLITVISFFLYRLYNKNKKSSIVLANKNEQLNNLYKDITDSINYAENIQNALLSSFKDVTIHFSEHFIFYKPAKVLSGDFYWSKKINDSIFIAVADSTGHGIPGALISILGMSYLNEIVNQDYIQPDTILNILRDKIKSSLNQKGEIGEQKDGLDISICSINLKTGEANFSGAFNSIYIISNNLNENPQEKHFKELKADRQPVSVYYKESPFTNHKFKIKKGDIIYLFTDGFFDQLNEAEDKKFTSKRFKKLLLSISRENLKKQKKLIEKTFLNWKGSYEQVDDVLIIGIEI